VAFVAAHAGAWVGGVVAGGALVGAVKSGQCYQARVKASRFQESEAAMARREFDELQEHLERTRAQFDAHLNETVKACDLMVTGYHTLSENVKQASSKTAVVINNLKFACTGTIPFVKATDSEEQEDELDEAEELEFVISEIQKLGNDELLKQEELINNTIAANKSLNALALRCYEEYVGLAVGSTQAQIEADEAQIQIETEDLQVKACTA